MSPDLPLAQALIAIHNATAQLGLLLRPELLENSAAKCAFDELVSLVSRSLSLAEDIGSTSCGGKRKSSSASYDKRRICRRRSQSYSCQKVLSKTLDDGHSWRKYGQKDIQNAKYPRSYFRCTHKTEQGCKAMRQVQVSEEDPSSYVITYLGEHTCQDPLLVPQIITTAGVAKGSQQPTSFGISSSEDIKTAEAVVPQPPPFGNDGDIVTSTWSMEMEYFMADMPELEALLGFHAS